MGSPHFPHGARRGALAGLLAAGLAAAGVAAVPAAAATGSARPVPAAAQGHAYRHGAVPMRGARGASSHATPNASSNDLNYGGGVDNIGVTTGAEKVYVIFYGSQWGTQSTNSSGYAAFSGDPSGEAPRVQALFKGLGTNNELWSGVMTQYCEGIASGSQSCPSTAAHVAYPTGGALAGVWADESSASPSSATGNQLANEAIKAAGHFGNTTAASNRDAQYVILSPTGTTPDGFNTSSGNFCAWHDWNGDTSLSGGAASSSYGDIAFTNDPYITDAGSSCGQGYVNSGSAGTLDGVTIVFGHEYAETVTDQNPAGGWTDSSGQENADKCAWNGTGGTGGAQNVAFSTGSFPMQATWSNDSSSCQISHAVVSGGSGGGGGGGGALTNGGFESGSFTGWTTSGTATVTSSAKHSGSYGAMLGSTSPSTDSSAAQTFTVPSGSSKVSFYYNVTCPDTVSYDWATATLKDNTSGTTTTVLAKTCVSSSGWKQITSSVTAGHSYTLTLANHDDDYSGDPTYTYYDDVTVS